MEILRAFPYNIFMKNALFERKSITGERIRQLLIISIFVTICSRFNLAVDFVAEGFIISLSIVMMAVFIYIYEKTLPVLLICFVTGIVSPGFRILMDFMDAPQLAVPDVSFFFTYGIAYTLIYRYVVRAPRTMQTFPFVIAVCDFVSNLAELSVRSLILPGFYINAHSMLVIFTVAILRSFLIQIIVVAIDYNSRILVDLEHDKEYKRLLTQTSIIESELYLMEKNTVEIEHIMKQAYDLNRTMRSEEVREELQRTSLDIARSAHEVKGDYLDIIGTLKGTFVSSFDAGKMTIKDIINLEKENTENFCRVQKFPIHITSRMTTDFRVKGPFRLMSILRNLLSNAAEAIGTKGGLIEIYLGETELPDGRPGVRLHVKDNGPGMDEETKDSIFITEFSTKFDEETGNLQRGLGLTLVKDFVEQDYHGTIDVVTAPGKGAEFILIIPRSEIEDSK